MAPRPEVRSVEVEHLQKGTLRQKQAPRPEVRSVEVEHLQKGTLRQKQRSLVQGQCSLTQKATAANYGPAMVVSAVVDCACGNQGHGLLEG